MQILFLLVLASLCGFAALIAPNTIALGGISVIALGVILLLFGAQAWPQVLVAVVVFLCVFQGAFLLAALWTKVGRARGGDRPAPKVGDQPFA